MRLSYAIERLSRLYIISGLLRNEVGDTLQGCLQISYVYQTLSRIWLDFINVMEIHLNILL